MNWYKRISERRSSEQGLETPAKIFKHKYHNAWKKKNHNLTWILKNRKLHTKFSVSVLRSSFRLLMILCHGLARGLLPGDCPEDSLDVSGSWRVSSTEKWCHKMQFYNLDANIEAYRLVQKIVEYICTINFLRQAEVVHAHRVLNWDCGSIPIHIKLARSLTCSCNKVLCKLLRNMICILSLNPTSLNF